MDAHQLVNHLLESDEVDPKAMAMRTEEPYWEAATWALRQWLPAMSDVVDVTLPNYIRNITRDTTARFTLDDEDEAEISRMLMRAWQHERLGMKSSEIDELKRRMLGESGEIDPKAFSARLYTLDVRDMKREVEAAIPGISVVGVHVLKGMLRNEGENREFYVYLAREPRSNSGFDPQNYPSGAEQRQAEEIIKSWLAVHGCTVLETRMIATSAMYKNVSRCTLTKYYFRTDKDVEMIGHSNDEPLKNVRPK